MITLCLHGCFLLSLELLELLACLVVHSRWFLFCTPYHAPMRPFILGILVHTNYLLPLAILRLPLLSLLLMATFLSERQAVR